MAPNSYFGHTKDLIFIPVKKYADKCTDRRFVKSVVCTSLERVAFQNNPSVARAFVFSASAAATGCVSSAIGTTTDFSPFLLSPKLLSVILLTLVTDHGT